MRACQGLRKYVVSRLPVGRSAWPVVVAVGDDVEVVMGVDRQVGVLRQVLAQQPVGVLTGAARPGAVGVAEVQLNNGVDGQVCVARHLLALVEGQGLAPETCPGRSVPRLRGIRVLWPVPEFRRRRDSIWQSWGCAKSARASFPLRWSEHLCTSARILEPWMSYSRRVKKRRRPRCRAGAKDGLLVLRPKLAARR